MAQSDLQQLRGMCQQALGARGLNDDDLYVKRLKWEIAEIKAQDEAPYFLDLVSRNVKYPRNENNLLTAWLLGLCNDLKIENDPECIYGEFPDIDVDYLKTVRDYLKNEWAVKEFGKDYVCNIGNYATFGIKMAFLDCATTYGENRHEINAITTQLKLKDDEGKLLTFDKALELYPPLKAYAEKYPHIAKAVKKLLHRNRGMGKHAGGLIIADSRIDDLVPLVKNAKDDTVSSAFVEGLHGQDLGPLGLIKFDMLVIADLERIAFINRLIKKRYGMVGVCAKPETPDWDWSDGCYRCDEKSLALANGGDLLGVFQFDSDGIRKLSKDGGVGNFRDIVAYSAIYRPGPLNMGMHTAYIERKHGREKYTVHPVLEPYLGYTYGVMCFQEQVMQVLHHAGLIPLKDTYAVVKAIAKKKIKGFAKYKDMFVKNAQIILGMTEAEVIHLWGQIESFAEYGFNRSHSCAYSYVSSRLLYQKANYPLEFWAGTLACEADTDTMNLYRRQAYKAGIAVNGIDLNRSEQSFTICNENDEIYMGFSNIRGVGEAPARRIVEARGSEPFKGIEDFMNRFGTDAVVLRALIGLRLFKEADPITLAKFVDHYKDTATKHKQRHQRFAKSMENYEEKMKALVPENLHKWAAWDDKFLAAMQPKLDKDVEREVEVEEKYDTGETEEVEEITFRPKDPSIDLSLFSVEDLDADDVEKIVTKKTVPVMATRVTKKMKKFNAYKQLKKEFQMRARSVKQYEERNVEESTQAVTLANFNPANITLDPKHVALLGSRQNSELEYLGFEWMTEMERSPEYNPEKPNTYDDAERYAEKGMTAIRLDGLLEDVQSRQSKKEKKTTYHSLVLVDAIGRRGYINVWKMDWDRCKADLKKGNLVSLIVRPPTGGFKSYSLWTPPRDKQYELAQKGIVQVVVLPKAEEEVLSDNDFEKKMNELTGDTDE